MLENLAGVTSEPSMTSVFAIREVTLLEVVYVQDLKAFFFYRGCIFLCEL